MTDLEGTEIFIKDNEMAINMYQEYIKNMPINLKQNFLNQLKNKNLACFCSLDKKCHADLLLELSNT